MRPHTSESIEQAAELLVRQAGVRSAPVDLNLIAEHLKAKIHYQTLEDQVSGVLIVQGGDRHILINSAHHPNRQRFTVGHELGHLVLHDGEGDQLFVDTQLRVYQRVGEPTSAAYSKPSSGTTPQQEREANMFAAALLMPAPMVRYAALGHDLWDEAGVAALSTMFAVSEQAMSIRLQQLKVLQLVDGEALVGA
ncbi:ImmA/IrrE family metallo-endopeptidase [Ralstonia pseudosolanacearum]